MLSNMLALLLTLHAAWSLSLLISKVDTALYSISSISCTRIKCACLLDKDHGCRNLHGLEQKRISEETV